MTWVIIDYYRYNRFSGVAYCSGVVAGLVCITPAAGYVGRYTLCLLPSIYSAQYIYQHPGQALSLVSPVGLCAISPFISRIAHRSMIH